MPVPSQPTRTLRRRRRGVLNPLPLPRPPRPPRPFVDDGRGGSTHLRHDHRDLRGIGAHVRAGSPTMRTQCEKSTHARSGINREIRYETTWDTTPGTASHIRDPDRPLQRRRPGVLRLRRNATRPPTSSDKPGTNGAGENSRPRHGRGSRRIGSRTVEIRSAG